MALKKTQKELLKNLEKLWRTYPSERLCQLLFNHTRVGTRVTSDGIIVGIKDPFFYLDEAINQDLRDSLKNIL